MAGSDDGVVVEAEAFDDVGVDDEDGVDDEVLVADGVDDEDGDVVGDAGAPDVMAWLVDPIDSSLFLLVGAEFVVLTLLGVFGSLPAPFAAACAEQPAVNAAVAPMTTRTAQVCLLFMPGQTHPPNQRREPSETE